MGVAMPDPSPIDTVAFAFAWIFIESAIPMIIPSKLWSGIVMATVGLGFLASAFGWLPPVRQTLAWKYSLPAFILIGASAGILAWTLVISFVNSAATSPVESRNPATVERSPTDPDLYGTMGSIVKPAGAQTELFLDVTVWNRGGSSSIAKNWVLHAACGGRKLVLLNMPLPNEASFSFKDSSAWEHPPKTGIPPGGEGHYKFHYKLPVPAEDVKRDGLVYGLEFYDVKNRPSYIEGVIGAKSQSLNSDFSGGGGGRAKAEGAGTAIGGPGGHGGDLGSGGAGGDAEVKGAGMAVGGEGGAGADTRVWRPPARSGYEIAMDKTGQTPDPSIRRFGRGGAVAGYDEKFDLVEKLRDEYFTAHSLPRRGVFEDIDAVPLDYLNERLKALNLDWRARVVHKDYEFFIPER